MAEMDTQVPGWLQRNWSPRETFDPTPWLQERYKHQQDAQVLPLKLQQMELQNKAAQLEIEQRGLQNDLANEEMNTYAEELPQLRSYLETVSKTPGGSLEVTPPAFRSNKAVQAVLQRQKIDADTVLGKTMMEDAIELTKLAAFVQKAGIDTDEARLPNGKWDRKKLNALSLQANEDINMRAANLKRSATAASSFTPVIESVIDPNTGKAISVLRKGPNSSQLIQDEKLTTSEKEREDYAKYVRQEEGLQALLKDNPNRTDIRDMLKDVQAKKQAWEVQHNAREETISMDMPGGGGLKIVRGGPQKTTATPTTAEETRLGNDIQSTANSLRVLNRLENQLDSNAVGILPTIGNVIFDEVLGQFDKDLVDRERVSARQNVGIATQQVLGELNNQGRISNMELKAIKEAMPGLGMSSSAEQGRVKLKELQKVLAEKGAHAAVTLKRDIPTEIIQSLSRMSDSELAKDVQEGALDKAVFWKVYKAKHPGAKIPGEK